MFKQAGLSVCLCLMAVLSNCLIAGPDGTGGRGQAAAQNVTSGPEALPDAAAACPAGSDESRIHHRRSCPRHDTVARWF